MLFKEGDTNLDLFILLDGEFALGRIGMPTEAKLRSPTTPSPTSAPW